MSLIYFNKHALIGKTPNTILGYMLMQAYTSMQIWDRRPYIEFCEDTIICNEGFWVQKSHVSGSKVSPKTNIWEIAKGPMYRRLYSTLYIVPYCYINIFCADLAPRTTKFETCVEHYSGWWSQK